MLSKTVSNLIEYVEQNPEKAQAFVEGINKVWKNRQILINNKEILINGLQGVEQGLANVTSLVNFSLFRKK
ncbi:hypothetical protein [Candidatus Uabimicrobium amorphum]|uniref:Uncharacterized protein n=1 Tax=Uabimicrobium amorphum TaxID=2596890 RepID=A0A5S9IMV9_UABAM|nr:hypothetical protein [Candidatus Uabimicrobium amorphum]BBM84447.1 hypothetical protein UABAM_02807 [Candidatus Uabimicrobium amorphum]